MIKWVKYMDKITIGIPRSLYYYYYGDLWKNFFRNLGCNVIISPKTTKDIVLRGNKMANDEMCLSLKNYLGHVDYLKDKCDYVLIPRIDNYGIDNQTCTNFLATYDIINNLFNIKILNYNIDLQKNENEEKGFIKMGVILNKKIKEIKKAYYLAKKTSLEKKDKLINQNVQKLYSDKIKILLVAHPYNIYDNYIGKPIIDIMKKMNVEIIYSDLFNSYQTNKLGSKMCKDLYWKYSKESIGAIKMLDNLIDGVIFLSAFPCGLDSLVNELVMRKINIPYLNLVIDDIDSLTGFETRIESFVDIIERTKNYA